MPVPDMTRTKGELNFLQQMAQKKLVGWCDLLVTKPREGGLLNLDSTCPYVQYAANRKAPWISDKGGGQYKMRAGGWSAATSFLKR